VKRSLALLLAAFSLAGCFRTVYRNLHAANAPPVVETPTTLAAHPKGSWQSFFVWGWFPFTKDIDAAGQCGGEEHVSTIETQNSFLTGLVGALAGYYVNIYSPWRGHVTCDHSPPAH
jgi:Bor protein